MRKRYDKANNASLLQVLSNAAKLRSSSEEIGQCWETRYILSVLKALQSSNGSVNYPTFVFFLGLDSRVRC